MPYKILKAKQNDVSLFTCFYLSVSLIANVTKYIAPEIITIIGPVGIL